MGRLVESVEFVDPAACKGLELHVPRCDAERVFNHVLRMPLLYIPIRLPIRQPYRQLLLDYGLTFFGTVKDAIHNEHFVKGDKAFDPNLLVHFQHLPQPYWHATPTEGRQVVPYFRLGARLVPLGSQPSNPSSNA